MDRASGVPIYGDMYGKQFQPRGNSSSASQQQRVSHGGNPSGGKQLSMSQHTLETSQRASHMGQNVFPSDVYGNPFSQACYLPAMTVASVSMNYPEKTQNTVSSSGYGGGSNSENCVGYQSKSSSSHKGSSSGGGNSGCDGGSGSGGCELSCDGHMTGGKSSSYHHHHQHQQSASGNSGVSSTNISSVSSGKKFNQSSKSDAHYHQDQGHQQTSNQRQLNQHSSSSTPSSSSSTQHGQHHHQASMQATQKPTRLKQLFCDYCGKEFAQEYLMLNHRRTHTGEKPFPCEICGKCFGRKDTLQRHRKNHNSVPNANIDGADDGFLKGMSVAGIDKRPQNPVSMVSASSDMDRKDEMMYPQQRGGNTGNSTFVQGRDGEVGTMVVMPFSHGSDNDEACEEYSHDQMPNSMTPVDIPKKSYQCDICLKPFAQRHYLRIHRRSHTGEKPYQCDFCIQKFARRDTLLIHRRTQHTGERPHHCELCGEAFFTRGQLQMHRRSKHVLKASNSNVSREMTSTPGDGSDGEESDIMAGKSGIISGTNIESGETIPMSGADTGVMGYRKKYQCDYCYKQFAQRYYLQIHRRIHTGEKLLQCDVCLKKFTQRHYLIIHKRTHTGEKPFQCDFCIQKFARKTTLQIHRRMHTGERPFQCDVCQKRFAQRDKLTVHLRTHSPKKRYNCEICLKSFAQRHYLALHQRSHTGEKPYQCEVCFKQFSRKNSLQMHHRSHTGEKPYQCEVCFKQFAQRQYLQLHKRTHTGEKAYQCQTCAKQFARRDTLQRHMRIHLKHLPTPNPSKTTEEEDIAPIDPYMWQI